MNALRLVRGVALVAILVVASVNVAQAQQSPAVDHATRVLDLLDAGKFEEVAAEFNAKMAAAMPVSRLRDVWTTIGRQAGARTSIISQRVVTQPTGNVTVVNACQFENAALNVMLSFDAEDKIAGMNITPRAPPAVTGDAPASTRFTEEAVTVGAGEWALPGTLSMPVGPIAAAVVLVHGSGPNDRDETLGPNKPFRDLAWGLADRGIAVLRYEKRTRQYAGKMAANANLTVREETTDDAILAAALLRAHDRIDPKRVFILGHSLGGTLAPRIAAEDRTIAGLIIMAGATRPFVEVAREQLAYLASLVPGAIDPEQALATLRQSAPDAYWKDFDAYEPAQTAATLTIPMLILQGERDYQVTLEDLQGWRDALRGHANVTIKSYPTLNHLFLPGEGKSTPSEYNQAGHVPDGVLDDITDWIRKINIASFISPIAQPASDDRNESRPFAEQQRGSIFSTPVLGAPFSGEAVTIWRQPSKNGSREVRGTARYYRDHAGRIRVEQTFAGHTGGQAPQRVVVTPDVDSRWAYVLDPASRTATRVSRSASSMAGGGAAHLVLPVSLTCGITLFRPGLHAPHEEESLGERTMEGVRVEGTRVKGMLNAELGRGETLDERWISPELSLEMSARSEDGEIGVVEYRVTKISRAEPPAKLFEVPADYALDESSPGEVDLNPYSPKAWPKLPPEVKSLCGPGTPPGF